MGLMATAAADGRWDWLGLSEDQACDWLMTFTHGLKGEPNKAVKSIWLITCNTLMAHRKSSFETIQLEPPFSLFGLRNMKQLAVSYRVGSAGAFKSTWAEIFGLGWKERKPKHAVVTIAGGPGDSPGTAVLIRGGDSETRVNAEYWYLYYLYGRTWKCGTQMLTTPDEHGRRFDKLQIQFLNGERWIYFDVTAHFEVHESRAPTVKTIPPKPPVGLVGWTPEQIRRLLKPEEITAVMDAVKGTANLTAREREAMSTIDEALEDAWKRAQDVGLTGRSMQNYVTKSWNRARDSG